MTKPKTSSRHKPKKTSPNEFWTMFWYGTYQRCSKHRTYNAALKATQKCEHDGGDPHDIVEVMIYSRPRFKPKFRP